MVAFQDGLENKTLKDKSAMQLVWYLYLGCDYYPMPIMMKWIDEDLSY